jgi:TruD family tRNA pseudouridine synthase
MASNDYSMWGIGDGATWADDGQLVAQIDAVLRTDPEDFLVTELDSAGLPVPMDPAEASTRGYAHPAPAGAAAAERAAAEAPVIVRRVELAECLTEAQITQLTALAADAAGVVSVVDLGPVPEKGARGTIRCSVKYALPRLALDLDKASGSLVVTLDAGHANLERLLRNAEHAAMIARYCVNSGLESGLPPVVVALNDAIDKDTRREIHQLLGKLYPYLRTRFDSGMLRCWREPPAAGAGARKRNVDGVRVPKTFTHFLMAKRNVDALDSKRRVARFLRTQPTAIAFGGAKDKRAVTWQRISVAGDYVQRVPGSGAATAFCSDDGGAYVRLYWPALHSAPLRMGEQQGNAFTITLRRVSFRQSNSAGNDDAAAVVTRRIGRIRERGFVNYFGPQRFGVLASKDELPGLHILRGDYRAAVNAVLQPVPGESSEAAAAKAEFLQTGKASAALRLAPRASRDLVELLQQLRRQQEARGAAAGGGLDDGTARAALESLAFDVRQIWLHAAQSYIFNAVATARMRAKQQRGNVALEVELGDWVQLTPGGDDDDSGATPALSKLPDEFVRVTDDVLRALKNVPRERVTLVAPIVGQNTKLQFDGSLDCETVDDTVRLVLQELKIPMTCFLNSPLGVPLTGGLRAMVHRVHGIDATVINGTANGASVTGTAVRVTLALPSSCYATVVLRELLGCFPAAATGSGGAVAGSVCGGEADEMGDDAAADGGAESITERADEGKLSETAA